MPGAAPPSLLVKSQSLEIKDEDETKQKPPQQSTSEASLCSEKPISFGDQEGVETLKSVTKVIFYICILFSYLFIVFFFLGSC